MALQETLEEVAVLEGHNGWVTSIACPQSQEQEDKIVTSSRDKTVMVWQLQFNEGGDVQPVTGQPLKALKGHSHFVQDVVVSQDGMFALSGSWDGTLRLWELNSGITTRKFIGHTKDVLSVAFSADNRQIVSGSRDKSIKLWNTLGECKYSIDNKHNQQDQHTNWVSCVRFSPIQEQPTIVSCGWDKQVKVWSLVNCKQQHSLVGHTGYVNYVTVSPDGSLCASGGKDGIAMLWDLSEGKPLDRLDGGDVIHSLCFSPNRYWLCASMESIRSNKTIKVWDLEAKETVKDIVIPNSETQSKHGNAHFCTCMQWSTNGEYLYAGYTDGKIRVFKVVPNQTFY